MEQDATGVSDEEEEDEPPGPEHTGRNVAKKMRGSFFASHSCAERDGDKKVKRKCVREVTGALPS